METQEFDVVVVGSGGAGLSSALSASAGGASVVVLERTDLFGGTSAISGAGMWAANNRYMKELGIEDSREDAITYLRTTALGRSPGCLIETFVDHVNECIDFIAAETGLEFTGGAGADYQPQLPGGKVGRNIAPGLFETERLGPGLRHKIRAGWSEMPFTVREMQAWGGRANMENWDWDELARRREAGVVGLGAALIGGLMAGCLRHGTTFVAGARARRLVREEGRIVGVVVDQEGAEREYRARHGVVLACGGFEWNRTLVERFLGVPMVAPGSPPFNEGDGLRMAMDVGAALANTSDAYWGVMVSIPGDEYEGHQLHRTTTDLRGAPGSIVVNRAGRRFVDEAMNYNDMGKIMGAFDPIAHEYPNLPCWFVFDAAFRAGHVVITVGAGDPTPKWMFEAPTLTALADQLGIDGDELVRQVEEFNVPAGDGVDPVFGRGSNAYDRMRGEEHDGPNPNLRPIGSGPYYAVELTLGCLGTKGGPLIDEHARVLDVDDRPIPGLYACGNAAVSVLGAGYASTLGPIVTMGYLAGRHLTGEGRRGS